MAIVIQHPPTKLQTDKTHVAVAIMI